ncbi:aldose epimerase [Phormidesmis sp. 146-12]
MFAIAFRRQQYDTYILTDQAAQSRLEVVPDRGGIITSWQVQGRELLYMDTARFADPSLSVRGGIPILFPICGNLPDNTYTHNGQAYTLKQHGFARDLPWEVLDRVTHDRVSIKLGLSSSDQTRAVYPFDFLLEFTYTLQGETLATHHRFTNRSHESMPFSIGFHPYFLVPDKNQLRFEIPANEAKDHQTQEVRSFSNTFDFDRDEIDWAFPHLSSQAASVSDLSRHTRMTLTYSNNLATLVFWTIKGKDFYCLEPWSAGRNALNSGDRLFYLEPGASLETEMNLRVDFI